MSKPVFTNCNVCGIPLGGRAELAVGACQSCMNETIEETDSDPSCARCGDNYSLRDGLEPTRFCDVCAQTILERLITITPEPPKAITHEAGCKILDVLQKEIWTR